ncbi:shikimate kinase [Saccharomonospora sp. NPDC006951]
MGTRGLVVIVGPPGSGKSTVGALLARRLGVAYIDADDEIEAAAGCAIGEIFTTHGEAHFRAREEETIAAGLEAHSGVYALGGGAVLSDATRKLLSEHTVVFLHVGMAEGVRRTGMSTARPLLAGVNPRATYKALLEARLPVYREVATIEVETDGRTAAEVVDAIAEHLAGNVEESSPERPEESFVE